MAHLITFTSTRFDLAHEPANPVNPIAGFSPLAWLRERLLALGYQCTDVDAEDWGWYFEVATAAGGYLVGCSADPEEGGDEIRVQIDTVRSLKDRLTGTHLLSDDDPLSRHIEQLVREDPATSKLEIDRAE